MPALMCQRVTGIDGKWGLLCKPLPPSNTTGMNQTQVHNAQKIARELAEQARQLNAPNKAKPVMHREPAVYRWQDSSTFTYIQHKKHFYNVHYADSSALKIETGLDVCGLGPFRFYTRFGLITEAVSGRPGADLQVCDGAGSLAKAAAHAQTQTHECISATCILRHACESSFVLTAHVFVSLAKYCNVQGADGIMGFGYTDLPRSAALMKTLTRRARPGWKLTQPSDMRLMKNNSFTVLSSVTEGELQLGGFGAYACAEIAAWCCRC